MKILVIGDACLDMYVYCKTNKFCPDAPVPILKPEAYISTLGMAGNVKDNLEALGADVELISNPEKIQKTDMLIVEQIICLLELIKVKTMYPQYLKKY